MAGGESMCPSQFWRSSIHAETQNEKKETYDGKTNDENGKFSNPDNDPWGMTDVFVCWRIKGNGSWLGKIHSMTAPFHESCMTATRITLMRRPTKVLWNFTLSSLRERNFLLLLSFLRGEVKGDVFPRLHRRRRRYLIVNVLRELPLELNCIMQRSIRFARWYNGQKGVSLLTAVKREGRPFESPKMAGKPKALSCLIQSRVGQKGSKGKEEETLPDLTGPHGRTSTVWYSDVWIHEVVKMRD